MLTARRAASLRPRMRRPVVRGLDDSSNFEDYSDLPPLQHEYALSAAEQALFAGF